MPKFVEVEIESLSPYSSSRMHDTPKLSKEAPDAFEERTWRQKLTCDDAGQVCIPGMGFKQCLDTVASRLGMKVSGKARATFGKIFLSGVICEGDAPLGVHQNDVQSVTINANVDGVRGSGKRVRRIFPIIPVWKTRVRFLVLADEITKEVFEKHMTDAGVFVGIGRFRPEKGGLNGRFKPTKFTWSEA